MPSAFVGRNGWTFNGETHIGVEGCSSRLYVVCEEVRKRTMTLGIYVPAGGKVSALGKGVSSSSKRSNGRGNGDGDCASEEGWEASYEGEADVRSEQGQEAEQDSRCRFQGVIGVDRA
jgi:hypothetical protein